MRGKHTCPCCSYTLLRHLRWGDIYWRCSHCYQEMPVGKAITQLTWPISIYSGEQEPWMLKKFSHDRQQDNEI